jgi:hypothetical protein
MFVIGGFSVAGSVDGFSLQQAVCVSIGRFWIKWAPNFIYSLIVLGLGIPA